MTFCSAVFDIGTSSVKGALIDKTANVLAYDRIFFPKTVTARDWYRSLEQLLYSFFAEAGKTGRRICGICISGNGPTLIAVNEKTGKEHLFLWNEALPLDLVLTKTAKSRSIFMPRIEALRILYPEVFAGADTIFSGQEFLIYKLTGKKVTVLPEKRYHPAYWTDEDLREFSLSMPPFVPLGAECGQFKGVSVFAGPPDFIAALIGTGTITPGTACDRAGSSEGLNICVENPPVFYKNKSKNRLCEPVQNKITEKGESSRLAENKNAPFSELRLLPSPAAPYWNLSFIIADSGIAFYNYLNENGIQFDRIDRIMKEIACVKPLAEGGYPKTAAGHGRKLIESIAYKVKHGMDCLENAAGFTPEYTVCGGQAKNEIWCNIKAKITGRKLKLLQIADAELLGNAAIVFTALNEYPNLASAAKNLCLYPQQKN